MANNSLRTRLGQERPRYDAVNSQPNDEFVTMQNANRRAVAPTERNNRQRMPIDEDRYEEELEAEELKREQHEISQQQRKQYLMKAAQVLLAIGCVYIVFLIFGVMNTQYVYGQTGEVEPLVRSVSDIREETEYATVQTQYMQARTLYEKVLTLDYRLGMQIEDPLLIAPEYEKLLDSISKLSVQIGALTVPAQYTQPVNMLQSWVQNDIALYCQYISMAISQNSVNDQQAALYYKDTMYTNFRQISQVVVTLGTRVPNQDMTEMAAWTPENYIAQLGGPVTNE